MCELGRNSEVMMFTSTCYLGLLGVEVEGLGDSVKVLIEF